LRRCLTVAGSWSPRLAPPSRGLEHDRGKGKTDLPKTWRFNARRLRHAQGLNRQCGVRKPAPASAKTLPFRQSAHELGLDGGQLQ
jgi:hypothetical protein